MKSAVNCKHCEQRRDVWRLAQRVGEPNVRRLIMTLPSTSMTPPRLLSRFFAL